MEASGEIPAQILQRTLQGVSGLQGQISDLERRYSERQDLSGVRHLLRAASVLLEAMRSNWIERSRELLGAEYPGPDNPLQRERAVKDKHQIPLDHRLNTVVNGLRRFESLLRVRLEFLAEPHGSAFDALSEPFRRLAKELPGAEEIELIFRPTAATGYEIWFKVMDEIQEFAENTFGGELNRAFEQMPRLMAIEYPWHYEHDTFLHAVIAHELGHIAFVNEGFGDQAWLAAVRESGFGDHPKWRRWYVEFGCDLLATRMIGPAYPLALIEHTIGENAWFNPAGPTAGGTHPPVPTRIGKLRDEVASYFDCPEPDRSGHSLALAASRDVVDEWMQRLPMDDGLPPEVDEVIDAALQRIDDGALGQARFATELFQEQLGPVWDALTAGIAPGEIVFKRDREPPEQEKECALRSSWSEPCDWRSILNGCYLRWLGERKDGMEAALLREGDAITEERLERCSHASGAIELSELHGAMLRQHEELRGMEVAR